MWSHRATASVAPGAILAAVGLFVSLHAPAVALTQSPADGAAGLDARLDHIEQMLDAVDSLPE